MKSSYVWIAGGILAVIAIFCVCMGLFGLTGFALYRSVSTDTFIHNGDTAGTPVVLRPTPRPTATPGLRATQEDVPTPQTTPGAQATIAALTPMPVGEAPSETLKLLENTDVQVNDPVELARRFRGVKDVPATMQPPSAPLQVGTRQRFWVTNTDTNETFQVDTTLQYVSTHVYFWIENSVKFNSSDLKKLGDTFENKIYPTDREFFGSEWTPGIDGDPHLYIVYAGGLGESLAGYFSSSDEYPPQVQKYSNAHEMFLLNADNAALDENFTYGVLAHEFQHMIHWKGDRNETSWMNEGFSEVAAFLNHYDVGGFDGLYTRKPDLQLNDWPNDQNATAPHYGEGFLFLDYFLDRFGEDMTKQLVSDPENGMASLDDVLSKAGAKDALTGKPITADDVFADWVVTSYLKDGTVGDGRFTYHNYSSAPQAKETERVRNCPTDNNTRDVHQYGVDYIRITCKGDYTIHFVGSTQTSVLATVPHSGSYAFWSNKGDESDMSLTRSFDFTNLSGSVTLNYWTWYDIEQDYDYMYVEASVDGQNWDLIHTPSGTSEDKTGANFGWGYTGTSGKKNVPAWIQEKVDLSQYAGKKVQLRFEYITDAAVNGEGFLLDDVSIPEANYQTDFEQDNGGWEASGFVRMENILPQSYRVELIQKGTKTEVTYVTLNADNTADIPIHIGGDVSEVVLVVSGTTPFTRQKTGYSFQIK